GQHSDSEEFLAHRIRQCKISLASRSGEQQSPIGSGRQYRRVVELISKKVKAITNAQFQHGRRSRMKCNYWLWGLEDKRKNTYRRGNGQFLAGIGQLPGLWVDRIKSDITGSLARDDAKSAGGIDGEIAGSGAGR